MNHVGTTIAASVLALSAGVLGAPQASARLVPEPGPGAATTAAEWPDEGSGYPGFGSKRPEYSYPDNPQHHGDMASSGSGYATAPDCHWSYHPACQEVPVAVSPVEATPAPRPPDERGAEIVQTGGSALAGAGIALGAVWIYQRRQAVTAKQ